MEDVGVEEDQGAEGLVLCGGADMVAFGECGEEGGDVGGAKGIRVAQAVMTDEATGPVAVGLFGAWAEVPETAGATEPVEEPGRRAPRSGSRDRGWWLGEFGHAHPGARLVPAQNPRESVGSGRRHCSACNGAAAGSIHFLRTGYAAWAGSSMAVLR